MKHFMSKIIKTLIGELVFQIHRLSPARTMHITFFALLVDTRNTDLSIDDDPLHINS